ncbi:MAG: site-specific integrase [Vallitaleaceae bacterium]|nr:site-specific integrase [Vallitaleaceae bacterium]
MRTIRDENTGKWKVDYTYVDWLGNRKRSTKRGFATKREAEEWGRSFLAQKQADNTMTFGDFLEVYYEDMEARLKEHTMISKKYVIDLKVLPYFKDMKLSDIKASTVRKWQNELMKKNYSDTYLKSINNQLSAILNHAVRFYELKSNPCRKAGSMGKGQADDMEFWTKEEFDTFIEHMMDKHTSYLAFSTLYWTGMRIGELLALTPADVDVNKKTISITKSYQRLKSRDVITEPKTQKSKRTISIPSFLVADYEDYFTRIYNFDVNSRIFNVTKGYLSSEMRRGVKESGVKKIRLHDLRHSHASHLIELGFTPVAIAERLGHEKVETTLNTYVHLYPNKQNEIADKLDAEYNEEAD